MGEPFQVITKYSTWLGNGVPVLFPWQWRVRAGKQRNLTVTFIISFSIITCQKKYFI